MDFINRIVVFLFFFLLLLGCKKENDTPPGEGVCLIFACLNCRDIEVSDCTDNKRDVQERFLLSVIGPEVDADPSVEQQIREHLMKQNGIDYSKGSALWHIRYCDKVCESISISASTRLFDVDAGNDLSDYFTIEYSNEPFLLDKDNKLVGQLEFGTTIKEYLSLKTKMLPSMELRMRHNDCLLSGVTFEFIVSLEDGTILSSFCNL